jgi:hypothetical protein
MQPTPDQIAQLTRLAADLPPEADRPRGATFERLRFANQRFRAIG